MQIDRNNYGMLLSMSKQVNLPKISSILQKMKIGQNSIYALFARSPSQSKASKPLRPGLKALWGQASKALRPWYERPRAGTSLRFFAKIEHGQNSSKLRMPINVYTCRKLPCTYFPPFLLRIPEIKYAKTLFEARPESTSNKRIFVYLRVFVSELPFLLARIWDW